MELLLSSDFALFGGALIAVLVIGLIEIGGLLMGGVGLSDLVEMLIDTDSFPETAFTNWLLVRELPLSAALVIFFGVFGVGGMALQLGGMSLSGAPLAPWLAVLAALLMGWLGLQGLGRLVRPLFGTHTSAVSEDSLVGLRTTLISPRCAPDFAGEARVTDAHGQSHMVMLVPAEGEGHFVAGDALVLHERVGRARFAARRA